MNRLFAVTVVAAVGAFCASATAQILPGTAPVDGLLLLKNGETLPGSITRSGDYFVVATADSEIQIRIHDTEAICRDLEDAYRQKAAKINSRSAEDRLALAQWCLDRKLYSLAARELIEAHRIDDLHPRIRLLERRLKAELAEPKAPPPPSTAVKVGGVSEEELEKAAQSVTAEALHDFTIRVQPLLVNYCATAGCHGPKAASSFQLQRVYLNERNDPRLVRQNLHAVLQQIDRQNLQASPLLTVPLSPHGGAKKPLFHAHNAEHYRTLVGWAARAIVPNAAVPTTTRTAAVVDPSGGALLQRLPIAPPTNIQAPADAAPVAPVAPTITAAPTTTPVQPTPAPVPASADPFDPAAFNRRRETTPKP